MPTSLSRRFFPIVCNVNTVDLRNVYGIAITMLAHEYGACNFAAVIPPMWVILSAPTSAAQLSNVSAKEQLNVAGLVRMHLDGAPAE